MNLLKQLRTRTLLRLFAVLAVALIGLYTLLPTLAATGRLYLTPATITVAKDAEVRVALRIDPGTEINGAGGELTYDAGKLELTGLDDTGTAFPNIEETTVSSGKLTMIRTTDGPTVSTDSLIVTVLFRALASNGSTTISLTGNAAHDTTYTDPTAEGATVNFSSPSSPAPNPTPAKPSTPPGSPPSPTGNPTPTPQAPAETIPEETPPTTEEHTEHDGVITIQEQRTEPKLLLLGISIALAVLIVGGSFAFIRYRRNKSMFVPPTPALNSPPAAPPPPKTPIENMPWPHTDEPGTVIKPPQKK